jgi:hypothetical protein
MDKPETTASEAAAVPEAPPAASTPVKAVPATEVTTPATAPDPTRAKAEKALRLAKALRDNLRRRKVAAKPARPSN